jgi:hypothetical protein
MFRGDSFKDAFPAWRRWLGARPSPRYARAGRTNMRKKHQALIDTLGLITRKSKILIKTCANWE